MSQQRQHTNFISVPDVFPARVSPPPGLGHYPNPTFRQEYQYIPPTLPAPKDVVYIYGNPNVGGMSMNAMTEAEKNKRKLAKQLRNLGLTEEQLDDLDWEHLGPEVRKMLQEAMKDNITAQKKFERWNKNRQYFTYLQVAFFITGLSVIIWMVASRIQKREVLFDSIINLKTCSPELKCSSIIEEERDENGNFKRNAAGVVVTVRKRRRICHNFFCENWTTVKDEHKCNHCNPDLHYCLNGKCKEYRIVESVNPRRSPCGDETCDNETQKCFDNMCVSKDFCKIDTDCIDGKCLRDSCVPVNYCERNNDCLDDKLCIDQMCTDISTMLPPDPEVELCGGVECDVKFEKCLSDTCVALNICELDRDCLSTDDKCVDGTCRSTCSDHSLCNSNHCIERACIPCNESTSPCRETHECVVGRCLLKSAPDVPIDSPDVDVDPNDDGEKDQGVLQTEEEEDGPENKTDLGVILGAVFGILVFCALVYHFVKYKFNSGKGSYFDLREATIPVINNSKVKDSNTTPDTKPDPVSEPSEEEKNVSEVNQLENKSVNTSSEPDGTTNEDIVEKAVEETPDSNKEEEPQKG